MLAKSGHTVVTTIHQPSSAMFMMFNKVLLLAEGGYVVYSGSAAGALPYFASLGLEAPLHVLPTFIICANVVSFCGPSDSPHCFSLQQYNPADFMCTHARLHSRKHQLTGLVLCLSGGG
jgi:hypothetical protein